MVSGHDSNASDAIGPELLGRLLDRHAAALELYARQLCDVPEDVVQEALIELAGQPRLPDNAAAWLYRVVRNKALAPHDRPDGGNAMKPKRPGGGQRGSNRRRAN